MSHTPLSFGCFAIVWARRPRSQRRPRVDLRLVRNGGRFQRFRTSHGQFPTSPTGDLAWAVGAPTPKRPDAEALLAIEIPILDDAVAEPSPRQQVAHGGQLR